ncbi:MAG: secondary thiamine-phosphate synthase enzyme YjbQ [Alphaproteobacteria bacterium]|uniref:Secondary thiamine-phosphate synthase enzyme YjbQ n=1 Tax=Candidatus Nitrobium versatile TaxID=2884831 RepID=A0A953M2E1_9BACT|nr:secondary thiamine-phosphate synthase enzyme YjbQ [Candidatus Nitrobium versatile]
MTKTLNVRSRSKTELIDITEDIRRIIAEEGIKDGLCFIYVPHTTAGITINEGADPAVKRDILVALSKLVPFEGDYQHLEGNSAAHIKATLVGTSHCILIEEGKPLLGTWQSIYFCEFDGPRHRRVLVKTISS